MEQDEPMELEMKLDEFDGGACSAPPDLHDLFDLLAPVGEQRFFSEYWEAKPFLIRNRARSLAGLVNIGAIDSIIGGHVLRPSDLRAARGHQQIAADELFANGVADKQMVLGAFQDGYTLIFDQIDRHLPALAEVLYAWESSLQLPVRSNAYLTPRSSSGFHRHFDTHDVIVVQICGTKTWEVCDAPLPLPHEEQQPQSSHYGGLASLISRVELAPGDVLYLPRGHVHAASANRTETLHLSVSIRNRALREVLSNALRTRLLACPESRRSYLFHRDNVDDIRRAISAALDGTDLRAAMEEAARSFHHRRSHPHRRLKDIGSAQSIAAARTSAHQH